MISVGILFCVVFLANTIDGNNLHLSDAQKEKVQKYTAECVKETGVKPDVVVEAKKGHLTDDEGLKKFIHCFFLKTGMLSSDGKVNTEIAISKLPPGVDKTAAAKLIDECKIKHASDAENTVYEIFKCYYLNTKQHVIFL